VVKYYRAKMIEDNELTGQGGYYDELGGAYYFADEKESFEPRTPAGGGGCGCAALLVFFLPAMLMFFC